MLRYALRRFLGAFPTLFVLMTAAFFIMRLAPGGPFDQERRVPAEVEGNLNRVYHLDEPLVQQYGRYLVNIVRGDFGPSFQYKDFTVTELIAGGFPVSLRLGGCAIVLAFLVGALLGTWAALRQNSWLDFAVMATAMSGITIPTFVMAPLLSLIFGVYLSWLPVGGWGGGDLAHSVLPVIALCLPQIAYIARLTRGSMIEVLRSNYLRTARAKGLPEQLTLRRHAMRAALLPVVSYLGPAIAGIITGSVVIEQIFQVPGLGRYFVQGALNRDYTLVMGVVVFYGGLIILLNLVVDLAYGLLDPRVEYR
ncbi:MAG TPA: oligopeptide ABC transporter permease OppB [Stellaceae bacterium]|jgi:oligopeptide transport system permease protein|nr:oligopeptide ABC transporter permease OppB [Stellaceae bacterium]